jgi:hypothetical protein
MPDESIPMPLAPSLCPQCHQPVQLDAFFCPNCGKKLSEPSLSTSLFTQAWIYILSAFAPPLGLWPGIKYIKSPDPKAQQIGMIAIGLTIVFTIGTLWLSYSFINSYVATITQSINGL